MNRSMRTVMVGVAGLAVLAMTATPLAAGAHPAAFALDDVQQAAELIEGLRSHDIDHGVIMIPNEIHDMARYSSWMILFNAADVFFDRQLNRRGAP